MALAKSSSAYRTSSFDFNAENRVKNVLHCCWHMRRITMQKMVLEPLRARSCPWHWPARSNRMTGLFQSVPTFVHLKKAIYFPNNLFTSHLLIGIRYGNFPAPH